MSIQWIALAAMVVCIPVSFAYTIFVQLPRFTDSRFRYQVWDVRDQLFDDIADGRITSSPAAWRLMGVLEALAESTGSVSLTFLAGAYRFAPPKAGTNDRVEDLILDSDRVDPRDRQILLAYLSKIETLIARQMKNSMLLDPTAWLTIGVLLVRALMRGRRTTRVEVSKARRFELTRLAQEQRDREQETETLQGHMKHSRFA